MKIFSLFLNNAIKSLRKFKLTTKCKIGKNYEKTELLKLLLKTANKKIVERKLGFLNEIDFSLVIYT